MLIPSEFYLHEGNVKPVPQFAGFNRHFAINYVGDRIRQMNTIKKILSKQRDNGPPSFVVHFG